MTFTLPKPPKILFYWMPRTAGTSIMKALELMFPGECYLLADHPELFRPDMPVVSFGHIHLGALLKEGILKPADIDERLVFTFVRDPVERLVSLYYYLEKIGDILPPFPQWIRGVTTRQIPLPGLFNRVDWSQANPQSEWLLGQKLDFIGSYHYLDRDWFSLCCLIGQGVPLEQHNGSGRQPVPCCYDGATLDLVRKHHAVDYDLPALADRRLWK